MPVVTSSRRSGSRSSSAARERRALAHRDDDVERLEPGGQGVRVGDVVVEHDDADRPGELRPVAEVGGDGLVVVEDGDLGHSAPPCRVISSWVRSAAARAASGSRYSATCEQQRRAAVLGRHVGHARGQQHVPVRDLLAEGHDVDALGAGRLLHRALVSRPSSGPNDRASSSSIPAAPSAWRRRISASQPGASKPGSTPAHQRSSAYATVGPSVAASPHSGQSPPAMTRSVRAARSRRQAGGAATVVTARCPTHPAPGPQQSARVQARIAAPRP